MHRLVIAALAALPTLLWSVFPPAMAQERPAERGYSKKNVDIWLEQPREVTDTPTRRSAKIAVQLMIDLPRIYIYSAMNLAAMSTKLHGFVPVPDGIIRLQGLRMDQ